jgi:hypothetical protein
MARGPSFRWTTTEGDSGYIDIFENEKGELIINAPGLGKTSIKAVFSYLADKAKLEK